MRTLPVTVTGEVLFEPIHIDGKRVNQAIGLSFELNSRPIEATSEELATMSGRARFWLSLSSLLLLLVSPRGMFGQATPCNPEELKASLPSNAQSYPDAIALSRILEKNGISVRCILLSKMDGTFDDQEGAALYRTDHGDFEALFLPRPQNFDQLKVTERQDGGRYSYSFVGPPRPWSANRIDAAFRMYFVKHQNALLVLSDKTLAATLEKLIRSH